jgi:hypothetical protein
MGVVKQSESNRGARFLHQGPTPSTSTNAHAKRALMTQSIRNASWPLLIVLPLILACGDSTSPATSVVGSYSPTIFITTPSGGTARNELQAGSTLTLNLNSNGTLSGHLHVAANGAAPVFDADMAGTWSVNGDVVTFTQSADTFVRNMAFTIQRLGGNELLLVGDQVFSGTRVNLTLGRT